MNRYRAPEGENNQKEVWSGRGHQRRLLCRSANGPEVLKERKQNYVLTLTFKQFYVKLGCV